MEPYPPKIRFEIRTLSCPKCGASLNVKNLDAARALHCKFCNSTMHLKAGQAELAESQSIVYPPKSALKIGLIGDFVQGKYQIIGRIRYINDQGEEWDEWLLLSEAGQYLWLQEDDWDFTIMTKFTPTNPIDPSEVTEYVTFERNRLEVEEKSTAFIKFFEGELTWKAKVNEEVHYIDAWDGETLYSIEWTDEEIQFFKGWEKKVDDLYKAFGVKEAIPKAAYEEDEDGFEQWGLLERASKGKPFLITLISGILFLLIALYMDFFAGTEVSAGSAPEFTTDSIIMGPYNLSHVNRVHKVLIGTNLNNQELYCEFNLLDEDKELLGTFDHNYWHESGYDSDGSWSESSLRCKKLFVLKEAGKYYLEICPEVKTAATFSVKVIQDAFSPSIFYWMGALTLIYPGLIILLLLILRRNGDD